jgi:hypothetical protein
MAPRDAKRHFPRGSQKKKKKKKKKQQKKKKKNWAERAEIDPRTGCVLNRGCH